MLDWCASPVSTCANPNPNCTERYSLCCEGCHVSDDALRKLTNGLGVERCCAAVSVSHQPAMGMQEIKERLAAQAGKSPTRAELARGARNRLRTKLVNEDASCTRGP